MTGASIRPLVAGNWKMNGRAAQLAEAQAVRDAISFFLYLRGEESWRDRGPDPALAKTPGTAELVNFLRVLLSRRSLGGEALADALDRPLLEATLGVLLKVKDDLDRPNLIDDFVREKGR